MNENVQKWYFVEYKEDDLGNEIDKNITFQNVFDALDSYKDIYALLKVNDSVVKERVFSKLAEIMNVSYDYIYNQWLLAD